MGTWRGLAADLITAQLRRLHPLRPRIWQAPDGRYRHHLIDPSTGEPES